MLEPWTPAALAPSRFRALAVRHGIDLEPQLPDPAPAYVDPAGAMHPALMEPMGSLLLHSWPTPGARAALVSRLLSEPGRPDPSDSQDPFVRLARFADQQRMEPEVRGSLTLLLVRGWLAQEQRSWRPVLPDPVAALRDPDVDAYKHRRARLDDTPWRDLLATIQRCAEQAGDHEALAFERVLVAAGAQWLALYGRWWDAARLLGPDEAMPADPGPLRVALRGVRAAIAAILGLDPSAPIEALLRASLDAGCAAEAAFVDAVVARPDGAITAKWLLEQQIRSMRNLMTATRSHSLDLHRLLRRSDVMRLATHIGWRVALLELWITDVAGADPRPQEDALLDLPDPPHATTLAAGLGRIRGIVLLRRLRRGQTEDAEALAARSLALAPEELAVRITHNDLRFHAGDRSPEVLDSLRAEHARWDSLSVCAMGARVADALGDDSRARYFRDGLAERALKRPGGDRWLLAATETLRSRRQDEPMLARLLEAAPDRPVPSTALGQILIGSSDLLDEAVADAEEALLGASLALSAADDTTSAPVPAFSRKKKGPGWERVLVKLPADSAGAQWEWLQRLRAAAEALRVPPASGALRTLSSALSRAADLELDGVSVEALAEAARAALHDGRVDAAAARWAGLAVDLSAQVRAPRIEALAREARRRRAEARADGSAEDVAALSALVAQLAAVDGAESPDAALQAVDEALRALDDRAPAIAPESPGLMREHPDFASFSQDALQMRPDALRRARELIRLFNAAGGRRDRKRLRGDAEGLYELRHRTAQYGGLRVFYRRDGDGWVALAAMSKYDDRPQRAAIGRVLAHFVDP